MERHGVELIGADFDAIQRGEDRQMFKDIVAKVGGESARSRVCFTMDEVRETVGSSVCRWWSGRRSPWAGWARVWRTPPKRSTGWLAQVWPRRRVPTC